jgi:hypothetical protein
MEGLGVLGCGYSWMMEDMGGREAYVEAVVFAA